MEGESEGRRVEEEAGREMANRIDSEPTELALRSLFDNQFERSASGVQEMRESDAGAGEAEAREKIVEIYVHGSRDSNWEQGEKLGLTGEALRMFSFFCEVKLSLSVNMETGEAKIIAVDDRPLQPEANSQDFVTGQIRKRKDGSKVRIVGQMEDGRICYEWQGFILACHPTWFEGVEVQQSEEPEHHPGEFSRPNTNPRSGMGIPKR